MRITKRKGAAVMKEKYQFSECLPKLGEMRRGTQVFVFDDEQAAAVYDDYSVYPDAQARRWQLEVYSKSNGRRLDRICMHRGRFTNRDDALAEIDRFRYRGRDLVFCLVPVDFSYDKVAYLWRDVPEESGMATYDEQLAEARRRLCAITDSDPSGEIDLRRRNIGGDAVRAFCNDGIAIDRGLFPFALVSGISLLYVSGDKSQWEYERSLLCEKFRGEYDSYDGLAPAFVYDAYYDIGVYGDIAFKKAGRSLARVR